MAAELGGQVVASRGGELHSLLYFTDPCRRMNTRLFGGMTALGRLANHPLLQFELSSELHTQLHEDIGLAPRVGGGVARDITGHFNDHTKGRDFSTVEEGPRIIAELLRQAICDARKEYSRNRREIRQCFELAEHVCWQEPYLDFADVPK